MNTFTEQLNKIFSEMDREEYISWIEQIQRELCPTCNESRAFNPDLAEEEDCPFRLGRLSAKDIYDGNCSEKAAEHWLGALKDAKGACTQIARFLSLPRSLFFDAKNRQRFVRACQQAQIKIAEGFCWKDFTRSNDFILQVGMAYKQGSSEDCVYVEMNNFGEWA